MNNTTTESQSNLDHAMHVSYIAWRICGILCTLFGVPGHIFLILITTNKTHRKEPTSLYFTGIAICELIFLFGLYLKLLNLILCLIQIEDERERLRLPVETN
jgi:hypothetical protein